MAVGVGSEDSQGRCCRVALLWEERAARLGWPPEPQEQAAGAGGRSAGAASRRAVTAAGAGASPPAGAQAPLLELLHITHAAQRSTHLLARQLLEFVDSDAHAPKRRLRHAIPLQYSAQHAPAGQPDAHIARA